MILLADIGNSRLKLACCDKGQLNVLEAVAHNKQTLSAAALDVLARLSDVPDRVVVANVASDAHARMLAEFCQRQWGLTPDVLVTPMAGDGITNGYTEHQQLGIDRWLAMLGAWHRYQGAQCVIDAGTAVTIDVIDRHGMHLGGVIIPGANMILKNLTTNTHSMNDPDKQAPVIGRSTHECLLAGEDGAVIDVVERVMAHGRSTVSDDIRCLITGGAAMALLPSLLEHCKYCPDLVLEGMMVMAGDVA